MSENNKEKEKQLEALRKIIASRKIVQKSIIQNKPLKLPPIKGLSEEDEKKLKEELDEKRKQIEKHQDKVVNRCIFCLFIFIYLVSMFFQ